MNESEKFLTKKDLQNKLSGQKDLRAVEIRCWVAKQIFIPYNWGNEKSKTWLHPILTKKAEIKNTVL